MAGKNAQPFDFALKLAARLHDLGTACLVFTSFGNSPDVNSFRAKHGSPLSVSAVLSGAAQSHARNLAGGL
ncbi:MAG TPA: hypothetical protein VEI95_08190, partial [Acidobacteriota bacterium]|nr:hypothetical protein [Acidobacteriota bacterium]